MRLVDLDVFASGFFVTGDKGRVNVFVKLTRHVVRSIEQAGLGRCQAAGTQRQSSQRQSGFLFQLNHGCKVPEDARIAQRAYSG